ncbi:MAG: formate dehydrogenase subunit alpha [Planctomycetota bacterium]|nr:MAG: formate dehydrogenase subunit alpha [Planctomycetota bacterium]
MNITIDGKICTAKHGQTVLQVARENDIYIPSLCWHERTGKTGRCRACLVNVKGSHRLHEACATDAHDGMVVKTDTSEVLAARKLVVELLLSNGKHDCLACEADGQCELQEMAYRLGIERPAFGIETEDFPLDETSEGITRDMNRCILCGRCVKVCNEDVMHEVLGVAWRAAESVLVADDDKPLGESSCVQCGQCVQACPTGALTFKLAKGKGRTWQLEKKTVICPYCGVGCVIDAYIRDGKIISAMGGEDRWQEQVNRAMLCVKGRFGLDFVNRSDRLKTPLVRRAGELVEATWEEALDFAAKGLGQIRDAHGSGAIGFLSSAKCSNEENYAMMRLARGVIGTNNIDHCARLCHSSTVAGLATTLGSGAMTNSMQEASQSDVILITGSNTTWSHPVFGSMIKRAVLRDGVKLIVVDPRQTDLAKVADLHLRQRSGSDVAWLMGMQRIIIEQGWADMDYVRSRCENWDDYEKSLAFFTPETVERLSGIGPGDLFQLAELFATTGRGSIYFSMGITQHTHGVDNVRAVANLSMITGNLGFPGGGVNPLRGQSNVQGACDMGALPNVFSSYQPVTEQSVREKFAQAWGTDAAAMDEQIGMTVTNMVQSMGEDIRGLYVMGENPMLSEPNLNHAEAQFKKLDLLIVQDIFLTETARLADVVFPAASFAEKTGTYTNSERRCQLGRAALNPPGEARQDYHIIAQLARRLGCENFPDTNERLFAEMTSLSPHYGGMTYERLEANCGLRWPCPTPDHPGTPILHVGQFVRGKGLLTPLEYRPPAEEPCEEYPMALSTGRQLEHFHTGSMSRRSEVLDGLVPNASVEINPRDAEALGISPGEVVRVSTRRGCIELAAEITDRAAPGSLFAPFHFAEASANRLTNDALDPIAKIPEFKICAAKLEKI